MAGPACSRKIIFNPYQLHFSATRPKHLTSYIGQRKHTLKEAQLEIVIHSGDPARINIKEDTRLTLQTQEESKSVDFLRQMNRAVQEK